jgi:serine/threonine-protein kinase RsbW
MSLKSRRSATESSRNMTFSMECMSNPRELNKLERFLLGVGKAANLDDGTFYRLHVAASEAVNNAILHGNCSDPRRKVCVHCEVTPAAIRVCVRDEGKGFDPEKIPNPLANENLLRESGRGIFLMRNMTDDVRFHISERGTTVELIIDLKRLA